MKEVFIGRDNLLKLIGRWAKSQRVYVPVTFDTMNNPETPDYELVKDEVSERLELHGACPAQSPKTFLFYAREVVAKYPSSDAEASVDAPATIVVGPRACDLDGLAKFDKVCWSTKHFTEEYDDPFYIEKRRNTILVSIDCTAPKETCFCTMMGGKPYAADGFDLNISPIESGYILTTGSDDGENLLHANNDLFTRPDSSHKDELSRARASMTTVVERQNAPHAVDVAYNKHELGSDEAVWAHITRNCVGCGACNRICPSCTCFLLVDQRAEGGYERTRNWDTCLSIGYARTGGGGNSRPNLSQRLENRIRCKLEYSRDRYGAVSCSGCGRCIDVCMGRIDMREAIKHVVTEMAKA